MTDFGDLDLNGDILFDDFLKLSFNFGKEGGYAEGDITGDGRIDFPDFLTLSDNDLKEEAVWSEGNFGADGTVGFDDFLMLSTNYSTTSAGAPVPEPKASYSWMLAPIALTSLRSSRPEPQETHLAAQKRSRFSA